MSPAPFRAAPSMPLNRRLLPEGDAEKQNDEGLRGLLKQVRSLVWCGCTAEWCHHLSQLSVGRLEDARR